MERAKSRSVKREVHVDKEKEVFLMSSESIHRGIGVYMESDNGV